MKNYIESLKHPEKRFKPTPFWSWNDKLETEELKRQINQMHKSGAGGYFMHARGGLITEYLSDDWFKCVETSIEEGSKLGMDSWAYDEEGWPSGFAGGRVTALGDKYHVRCLEHGLAGKDTPKGEVLGYYSVNKDGFYNFLGMKIPENAQDVCDVYDIYFVCHIKNEYYCDILNPEVVKAFIDITYEEYYKRFGDKFGDGQMPGFFTDEPQYMNGRTPWSYVIPDEFKNRYGYSPEEHLICLFMDLKNAEHFRYDFWKLVSDLYTKSFGKQIFDWCNEHNCLWTGHAMNEDDVYSQMRCTAGVMPIYEYMHKPGIDWLGRHIASPIIPKQVGSAARQLGKELVLTETFALCGWDVSFEELKWIAEWQFINGVTSICQHLEGYSIRGMRKRDYPPSIFYQSPWWDEYNKFNEYFSRLSKLLAEGGENPDVLMIHPMHSGWTSYSDKHNERIHRIDIDFENISSMLAGLHVSYHYGDENIIASHGSVKGNSFVVGNCSYKVILLPNMETLDESTYMLLDEFLKNGGRVVSVTNMPTRINGRADARLDELSKRIDCVIKDNELLLHYFSNAGVKNISITDSEGEVNAIRHCERNSAGGQKVFFIHNQDRYGSYDVNVRLKNTSGAVRLVLENMSVLPLRILKDGNDLIVQMHFEPMQSYIILAGDDLPEITENIDFKAYKYPLSLNSGWEVVKSDPNCLTLDYISYSLDGGKTFEGPLPVLDVMDRLINMRYDSHVVLKYTFDIDKNISLSDISGISLIHEYSHEKYSISVNGKDVIYDGSSWWLDKGFKRVDINGCLQNGKNEILVSGIFYQQKKVYDILFGANVHETERNKLTYDTEIESVYIIGDFGVYSSSGYTEGARKALYTDGGFYITSKNTALSHGELVTQGYPFFRGNITVSQDILINDENIFKIKRPFSSFTKLYINDVFVRDFYWADYETDISPYVKKGVKNKISLEFIIGNRNLLGPHHHPDGECYGVNPGSFSPHGNYSVRSWRHRYCFVKAGLNSV